MPKTIKDGTYVINLDEYADVGTHWIALYVLNIEIIYFEYKHIVRIQAINSIMCGYFCIGFIDFMLANKTLIDYTSFFSPYDLEKNDNIILSYFKNELNN